MFNIQSANFIQSIKQNGSTVHKQGKNLKKVRIIGVKNLKKVYICSVKNLKKVFYDDETQDISATS